MAWLRLDCNIFEHPRLYGLSHGAHGLFIKILCTLKSSSGRDSLSASYWDANYWSNRINQPATDVANWLKQLTSQGVILNIDGRMVVHDWREYQMDPTASERQRTKRKRAECHGGHSDMRESRLQDRTGQDITGQIPHNPQQDAGASAGGVCVNIQKPQRAKRQRKVQPTDSPDFVAFWSAYPRREGKGAARKVWEARAAWRPPLSELLSAIEIQKTGDAWTRDGGAYIPHPATWLRQERWSDEVRTPVVPESQWERKRRLEDEDLARRIAAHEAAEREAESARVVLEYDSEEVATDGECESY